MIGPRPDVAVIIVNWNGKSDTLACLESLRADRYAGKQIFVIDNGSNDDSVVCLRAQFPEIEVIETGSNLGFTGGNNQGIAHAAKQGFEYFYLLNNDTTSEPDAITQLVFTARTNSQYGILSPVIYYFDEPHCPWFVGSSMDLSKGVAVHDNRLVPEPVEGCSEIPWASGCAMLIPAALMRRLGGFDERYFLNWEDIDLCLRARKLGNKIGLVPSAKIYHKVGRSFERASDIGRYYHVRNHLLLLRTHLAESGARVQLKIILDNLRGEFRDWRRGRSRSLGMTLRAVRDHVMGRYGPLKRPK